MGKVNIVDEAEINRLTDMDTREVSLVDRAANKRRFLVVKRDASTKTKKAEVKEAFQVVDADSGNVVSTHADRAEAEKAAEALEPSESPRKNEESMFKSKLDGVLARLATAKAAVDSAPVEKGAGIPSALATEALAARATLKSIAGALKGVVAVVSTADLSAMGGMSETAKAETTKVLDEVSGRISAVKADLADDATMLDATQASKLDAAADLLAKIRTDASKSVVAASSVSDEDRDTLLKSIAGAINGLADVYVNLQTETARKSDVADSFEVGSLLHGHLGAVEKALAGVVVSNAEKSDRSNVEVIVETLRGVGDGIESHDVVKGLRERVVAVAKAATMYQARWLEGGKYSVVLATGDEKVAEFDSWLEAEKDALRRNIESLASMAKSEEPKLAPAPEAPPAEAVAKRFDVRAGGKGYQVVDAGSGEVVWDGEDEAEAKALVERMNAEKAKKADEGSTAPAPATTEGSEPVGDATETAKVGAKMKGDRLNRLKGAIKIIKEALSDLLSGSVSTEKFKKGIAILGEISGEVSAAKRAAAAITGGVEDERTTSPEAPNVGAGVQPDESTVGGVDDVVGEGTPSSLADVLKRVAEIEKRSKAKDDEIAGLKRQVTDMKKRRSAPSTAEVDDEPVGAGARSTPDDVQWPRDMASWKPGE